MHKRILLVICFIVAQLALPPFFWLSEPGSWGKVYAQSTSEPGKVDAPSSKAQTPPPVLGGDDNGLNIVSWGGAYQMSQEKAYFTPFTKSTGLKIIARTHHKSDRAGVLEGLENSGSWDVADVTSQDEQEACGKGLIKPLKIEDILPDSEDVAKDFLPGALGNCGIGSVAWSSVIVVNRRKFKRRQPKTVKDLFNIKKFAGKRALPRGPKYLLELAMMADGVAADGVYDELDTSEGEDRAFEQLDKLRDNIIWWDNAGDALKFLEEGKAVMAMAYSGRAFVEITGRMHPFDIIWDGQIYDIDYWVVSKKTSRSEAALKFLRFALSPDRLAMQARWFPYGPLRKSAVPMVGKHAQLDLDMSPYLPTEPAHMKSALKLNTKWWGNNEKRLKTRFEAWLKDDEADADGASERKQASE